MFLVMAGYLAYFIAFEADETVQNSYNRRWNYLSEKVVRGDILSSDGTVLASTEVREDGEESRIYPYGKVFCHVVGYNTNGRGGIEAVANYALLTSNESALSQLALDFAGEKKNGDTVITTLDVAWQQAAYDCLDCEEGAVVVLEPSTGKIIAMVSKPDFDPEELEELLAASQDDDTEDSYLVNRALQGLYPPGSTFKILTLLEYYRENKETEDFSYTCTGSVTVDGYELHCASNKKHGNLSLKTAFAKSCNSAFASIGLSLDRNRLGKLADSLLFNTELPLEMPYRQSSFTLTEEDSDFMTAQTVIGQGETLVTPMHLAMIMSAIANDGVLMTPYVIERVESVDGTLVEETEPSPCKTLFSSEEAAFLAEYLSAVTESGTASSLGSSSRNIYGKTGTAQTGTDGVIDSWFVGRVSTEDGDYVICVLKANISEKSENAVSVTKKILNAMGY